VAVNGSLIPLEWLTTLWAAVGVLAGGILGLAASDTALRRHLITYA
jgi:hypothetical protein